MFKHATGFILCCLIATVGAFVIPIQFQWVAFVTVSGEAGAIEAIPEKLQARWLDEVKKRKLPDAYSKVSCKSLASTNRAECSATFSSKSAAHKAERVIESLAKSSGWLTQTTLKNRMENLKEELDAKNEALASVESELKLIPLADETLDKKNSDIQLQKRSIATDLANKQAQLTMIQEALPQQTADKDAFLAKEKSLLSDIEALKQKSMDIDQILQELEAPFEKKHALEKTKNDLKNDVDRIINSLVQLGSLLEANPSQDKFADPQTFQITTIDRNQSLPQRSLTTLYWSFLLGCFFYGLVFHPVRGHAGQKSPPAPYIYTTQELTQLLKAPYLGELKVRHEKDNG